MTRNRYELRDAYNERDRQLRICEHISAMRVPQNPYYAMMLQEDYNAAFLAYVAACERVQMLLQTYRSERGIR